MNYVVLLVLLPLTGAFLALVGKLTKRQTMFSIFATLPFAGMALTLVLTAPAVFSGAELTHNLGNWPEPVGIALHMNGLAWASSVLVVLIAVVVSLASFSDPRYRTHYFFFLQLLVAGMEIVILTGDLFTMFVGFEIIAISAYVLIAFDQTDEGLLASLKYLLLSSVGILFFLFGIFLIYRDFGSLALRDIAANAASGRLLESTSIHFAVAALCVGIGVRTAFIPFHTWLPEAHAYAPHPVSAMLSGALIKVSLFAMVRILIVFSADYLNELLVWIGASTALLAVIWALAQSDAKRLLAYHSISQMGYVLAAVGAASAISVTAAFSHALHHAIFKSLLFIVAGTAIHMTGSRNVYEMTPIGRRAPILAICFLVGALSISGIPPFNGFARKQLISLALDHHPAYTLLWVTSIGTTASFIKISRIVIPVPGIRRQTGERGVEPGHRAKAGFIVHLPVILLGLLSLATGIFARPVSRALHRLLTGTESITPNPLPAQFFAPSKLLATVPILALGVVLYLIVVTKPGRRAAHAIESVAPELRTVLLFFVLGLGLFSLVAYL